MSDSEISVPSDIEEAASNISSLLPESRVKYETAYGKFEKWCEERKEINFTKEKALLAYFEHLSQSHKPTSLWTCYSMLRSVISTKTNVNISKYTNLMAFLKRSSRGYRPKKSKILTKQDIAKFLQTAEDDRFLLIKVALIIGLCGACRRDDLTNLMVDDVIDEGQYIRFLLPTTKNKSAREFFVTPGDVDGVDMVTVVRKYIELRPVEIQLRRFFVSYRNGKCTRQPVGINTFGGMPKNIATFLKLDNPKEYTARCFRRSSTSLLADSGVAVHYPFGYGRPTRY